MLEFVIKRLLQGIVAIIGVTVVVFLLLHLAGDPSVLMLPRGATEVERAAFLQAWGLDKPLYVQYVVFLSHALRGDFGDSIVHGIPALDLVLMRLPATILLTLVAMLISLMVGIPAGIIAAIKRNSIFDYLTMAGAVLGQSIAQFWLGLMLIILFAVKLGWLPTSGMGSLSHIILPALTLSPWVMALVARLVRSGMLEVLGQDYMRTARAKGLPPRLVLIRHALRNALIPVITMIGLSLAFYVGGDIIVESIFAWPGIGLLSYDSVLRNDYSVVQCIVTLVAFAFVTINLLVDISLAYLDPRIRLTGGKA